MGTGAGDGRRLHPHTTMRWLWGLPWRDATQAAEICPRSILGWDHSPLLQEFYQEPRASVASRMSAAHWPGHRPSTKASDGILGGRAVLSHTARSSSGAAWRALKHGSPRCSLGSSQRQARPPGASRAGTHLIQLALVSSDPSMDL